MEAHSHNRELSPQGLGVSEKSRGSQGKFKDKVPGESRNKISKAGVGKLFFLAKLLIISGSHRNWIG